MLPGRQMEGMLRLVQDVSALFAWHDAFRRTTSVRKKVYADRRSLSQSGNLKSMPVIQPNSKGVIAYPATAGISLLLVPLHCTYQESLKDKV